MRFWKGFTGTLAALVVAVVLPAGRAARAQTDVVIDSYTFGTIRARSIGPAATGGRITDIEAVPSDPRIIYVGTAGGGVWKSVNGGITFTPIFDKYTQSIGSVTLDPNDPDTIWVGTGEVNVRNTVSVGTGLYKSTDGGKTWSFMGFKDSERIADVVVDPRDSKTVYVCILGHLWNDHEERGVYKTSDSGKTWKRVLYVDAKTGCINLKLDPQEPDVVYASMWQVRRWPWFFKSGGPGSGFFKSTDGGKTWRKITRGLPKGDLGKIGFDVAPSRPGTLYAIVEAKETALYRSDDMGESWRKISDPFNVKVRPFYFANVRVDPSDHRRIYNSSLLMFVSRDGGKTFSMPFLVGAGVPSMVVHPDHHAIWINPKNPHHLLVGTDGGVYVSYDRGASWKFVNTLPVSQFYHVSVDQRTPYWVCGGLQDNGSWCGPSRAYSSLGIRNKDWVNVGGGDGFYVFVDPTNPDIVYNSWQGGHLQWFNRKTGETRDIRPFPKPGEPPYRFNWNAAVELSRHEPGMIYIGAQFLFRSRDRGQTWEKISPDLTTNDPAKQRQEESGGLTIDNTTAENHCTIYDIAESPKDPDLLWVCTDDGNLQVTSDGGKTWSNVVGNIPGLPKNTWCSSVEPSHHQRETAYVTFDGHRTGDMKTYVFKTEDLGRTWVSLATDNLEGYALVIREDPVNPNLLFLGTEFGLFISIDGGRQWAHFVETFPRVAVRDMVIHPRTHDLVIATHGRGIWIIDDLTPLRHLTPEVLEADAALLPARPTVVTNPALLQEFPGHDDYFGQNPESGAVITYYLKRRHIFGDLRIEVLDPEGKVIATLPTTKRRGINRVYWNMRLKPPKIAAARGLSPVFALGPMVPEGTYRVRLVKGKQVYEGAIELVPDPVAKHPEADRKLRQQVVMRLYRMQERLAYVANTVLDLHDQALERKQQLAQQKRGRSLQRRLQAFADRLKKFHGELVSDNWLAGERLREKVLDLYSSVSAFLGRPTQSQMDYMEYLDREIQRADERFHRLVERELPGINRRLRSARLKPLHLMTEEEYAKRSEQ